MSYNSVSHALRGRGREGGEGPGDRGRGRGRAGRALEAGGGAAEGRGGAWREGVERPRDSISEKPVKIQATRRSENKDRDVGLPCRSRPPVWGSPRGGRTPPTSASSDAFCLFSALGQEAASFSVLSFSPPKKYVFLRLFDGFLVDIFYSS